jgi:hypothetical protein
MLTTLFATLILASVAAGQSPGGHSRLESQGAVDTVAIRGTTELTSAEAYGSARHVAIDHLEARWRERSERLIAEGRPFWLPEVLCSRAVDRWIARQAGERALCVVDREDREREHEFGKSFQTTLWIAEAPAEVNRGETQLRRELHRTRQQAVVLAGGTVGLWAVLAFAVSWIDRLSRGYMTARLRVLGLLVGVAVPSLAFLL